MCLKTMTKRHKVQWICCNKNMQGFNISLGPIGRKSVQNTTQYVNEYRNVLMLGSNRFSQVLLKKFNSCVTETQCFSTVHKNRLILLRQITAVWCENQSKQRNDTTFYDKKQGVFKY
jgi:hypothetical protein